MRPWVRVHVYGMSVCVRYAEYGCNADWADCACVRVCACVGARMRVVGAVRACARVGGRVCVWVNAPPTHLPTRVVCMPCCNCVRSAPSSSPVILIQGRATSAHGLEPSPPPRAPCVCVAGVLACAGPPSCHSVCAGWAKPPVCPPFLKASWTPPSLGALRAIHWTPALFLPPRAIVVTLVNPSRVSAGA